MKKIINKLISSKILKTSNKINFGCGTNLLDGFINVDLISKKNVYPHNVTKKFPLKDSSIEAIYTEHMIEHLQLDEVIVFLKDCFRLLRKDTPIRIATPNIKKFIDFYNGENQDDLSLYRNFIANRKKNISNKLLDPVFFLNEIMSSHGHKCVMDFDFLTKVLEEVGFTDIVKCETGKSDIKYFNNIEGHGKIIGDDMNRIETLVVEAWKK